MTRLLPGFLLAALLLPSGTHAQQTSPTVPNRLPVKRVVLYKNGVGYFEHLGRVNNNQEVAIGFTSGQLNDVLKSVTVLDLNGGRIAGIAYDSMAPVDKQLGDLRLLPRDKTSLTEFLGALRGARIEVRSGTAVMAGRLLSIERKTRISGGTTLEVDYLSLITDSGELRTTELSPQFSVRLLERGLSGKVDRYLDVISSAREPDLHRMVISAEGSGERSLFISYISEVPVWKSTYRIVLPSKAGAKPLLQGWAIIDNTVGEDWENVELSLVAGAPHSFIQNLAQPFYARRPVVPLPEAANLAPQTHEATLVSGSARLAGVVTDASGAGVPGANVKVYDAGNQLVASTNAGANGAYEFVSLPEGLLRLEVDTPGFRTAVQSGITASNATASRRDVRLEVGSAAQRTEVTAAPSTVQADSSSMAAARTARTGTGRGLGGGAGLGRSGVTGTAGPGTGGGFGGGTYALSASMGASHALTQELGDLFEYKLKQPITILKNRSALVPIAQATITADKVSIWNDQAGLPRPQRGLWLTNSSGLTLDGGSFSVLEEDTFAGEGIFDPIKPGEKRLISYATDLALNTSSRHATETQRVSRVRVSKGILIHESETREKTTYTFRNEDSSPRTVIVEHPVRAKFQLRSEPQPVESTPDWHRFRLQVEPKETALLQVEESLPAQATYAITNLTGDQLTLFVHQGSVNADIEKALRGILAQKTAIDDLEARQSQFGNESSQIFDDQQRLRENMKALKGSAEEKALLQRYTKQLNDQETRLEELQRETKALETKVNAAKASLTQTIDDLAFDVKL